VGFFLSFIVPALVKIQHDCWQCFLHVHTDVFKTQSIILKFYTDLLCKQSLAVKTQEADECTVNL